MLNIHMSHILYYKLEINFPRKYAVHLCLHVVLVTSVHKNFKFMLKKSFKHAWMTTLHSY
jgi:hypothetical protein